MPDIGIRPVGEGDLDLLWSWLTAPHLADKDDPTEQLSLIRGDLAAGAEARFAMWIAEKAGEPFAYVQDCDTRRGLEPFHADEPLGTRSIGLFIGPPERLGHGLAAPLIDAYAAHLRRRGAVRAIADVEPGNARSHAAFRRAGFRDAGLRHDVDGDPVHLYRRDLCS